MRSSSGLPVVTGGAETDRADAGSVLLSEPVTVWKRCFCECVRARHTPHSAADRLYFVRDILAGKAKVYSILNFGEGVSRARIKECVRRCLEGTLLLICR